VFSPSQIEFDAFEKYILETYAANWKKNGGFIVRPPSSLKLLPTKTENRLPTNGRYDHLKQKNDPIPASLHTATQQEGKGFFYPTLRTERKARVRKVTQKTLLRLSSTNMPTKPNVELYTAMKQSKKCPFGKPCFTISRRLRKVGNSIHSTFLTYSFPSSQVTTTANGKEYNIKFVMRMCNPFLIPSLIDTFRPDQHRPDKIIPGINVPQIFLGQLGNFSCWQI
jgi:hypothetical protein